jgi:hypothetical protein
MIKKAALFGAIIAVLFVLSIVIIVKIGLTKTEFNLPLVFHALLIGIPLFVGMHHIRKNVYSNAINFAQAFYSGVIISVCAAILVVILMAGCEMIGFLIPDLIEDATAVTISDLTKQKKTQAEINQIIAGLKKPYMLSLFYGMRVLMISAFSSTILSLFVRNRDTFNENK